MGIRESNLSNPLELKAPALNEALDDLSLGVENERVRPGANIEVAKLNMQKLGIVVVQSSETIIRHQLGSVPSIIVLCPMQDARVWEVDKKASDKSIVLQASEDDVRVKVAIFK